MRERLAGLRDALRASFGLLAGLAMLGGIVLGFLLPELEEALRLSLPVISFNGQSEVRGLLETIATVTVSVAGLTFSVTVVAFTLASSQLSPRVLRSFRGDRISQITLAMFLGTFMYCLAVLVRMGSTSSDAAPPNLAVTVALVAAFASFVLFARFIGHIVTMLQPSSVIDSIRAEARTALDHLYPGDSAGAPADRDTATARAYELLAQHSSRTVSADEEGYVNVVSIEPILGAATAAGVLVRQQAAVGSFVLPGAPLAEVVAFENDSLEDRENLDQCVRDSFVLNRERGIAQDVAFPIRQLADIALKALSPGINDPTTAINALEATAATLIRFTTADHPAVVRVDEEDQPRFVAAIPGLGDLVRLGFDQPRVFAAADPTVSVAMIELLGGVRRAAVAAGLEATEIDKQEELLREAAGTEVRTETDGEVVRTAEAGPHGPNWR